MAFAQSGGERAFQVNVEDPGWLGPEENLGFEQSARNPGPNSEMQVVRLGPDDGLGEWSPTEETELQRSFRRATNRLFSERTSCAILTVPIDTDDR